MALLRFNAPPGGVDNVGLRGAKHAQKTGRSWWSVRYTDGTIINEWDRDPGSPNGHADWPRIPKRGMQKLRLYCPNGVYAELGSSIDSTGLFLQLKRGTLGISVNGPAEWGKSTTCHLIGIIDGLNGECTCYAWEIEPEPRPLLLLEAPPDERLYRGKEPGLLWNDYQGWKRRTEEQKRSPEYQRDQARWRLEHADWARRARGHLRGPWRDSVYLMAYDMIGPVSADNLALVDGEGR